MPSPIPLGRVPKRAFALIFAISVAVQLGNTGMNSVLPAIGRSIGLPDFTIAVVFSLSALLWAVMSPVWARASDRRGRKPLVLLGLAGFMVSMLACGAVVSAGLHRLAPPLVVLALLVVARALFGLFGSASNPATQAYVAERTSAEERTQAMSNLAGAVALGTVIGPFLAPLFVLPVVGFAGPMLMFGLIAAVMLALVWRHLPESEAERRAIVRSEPGGPRPPPLWRDPRVKPFLIYGFLVATCQNAQLQTLAFLIFDKLRMPPVQAQGFIAIAMMFGAVASLLAQWGLIRMFEMTPRQLLRWGAAVAALGNLVVALSPNYWTVVAGYALASLGFGFARPGFTAGSSLAVGGADQARVAGAIGAVNGLNVLLAPLFVWLYGQLHPAPFVLNAALLLAVLAYAFQNRQLRSADADLAGNEASAVAGLERADEGGA